MSWLEQQPVEDTPEVFIDLGQPLGVRAVTSWRVTREIVASALPGSLRLRAGLSIGAAAVTIDQESTEHTPWSKGAELLTPGGLARLWAERDDETWELSSWLVGTQGGSLAVGTRPIELDERQYAARGDRRSVKNLLPAVPNADADPAWMIDTLVRQAGYYSTPKPVASCILSLPLNGALWSEVGAEAYPSTSPLGWGALDGVTGPVGPWGVEAGFTSDGEYGAAQGFTWTVPRGILRANTPVFITATVEPGGTLMHHFPTAGSASGVMLEVRTATSQIAVRAHPSLPWVVVPYTPGLDPNHPHRVQVELQRAGNVTNPYVDRDAGNFGPVRARARSAHDAPWSDWAVDTTVRADYLARSVWIRGAAGSSASGIQYTLVADPALWAPANADISALGGVVPAPWVAADRDAWTAVQDIAAAWLAVVWVDRDDFARGRTREHLAGIGTVTEVIDLRDIAEDFAWTIDPADQADRLEVTWAPIDVVDYNPAVAEPEAPLLWEGREAVRLAPGETVEVIADMGRLGFLNEFSSFLPAWVTGSNLAPSWDARYQRGGGGGQPPNSALAATARQVSADRVIITLRNTTASVLYTVNDQGRPHLQLRGYRRIDQDQPALIERGSPADTALTPLSINLGRFVQRAEDARAIADFLWARAQAPGYRATGIPLAVNWARDVAQIVRVVDPESGLDTKALLTKVDQSGAPGRGQQIVDLVVLAPTWDDFDDTWSSSTWDDFDAAWSGRTWADFDTDPLSTGA